MSIREKLKKYFWLRRINIFLHSAWGNLGIQPARFLRAIMGIPGFLKDFRAIRAQNAASKKPWALYLFHLCLADRLEPSGTASGAYFHQDLLVARRIFERQPQRHIDVGSRVDGFVAHVASYRPIEVFDVRPQSAHIPNIQFHQADLMALSPTLSNCCDSLSCLHALEHFGLGRYADSVDLDGHIKGFHNLSLMLQPGGMFYLSVPIGWERIDFNGNRVFHIQSILDLAEKQFELQCFSLVDDQGNLQERIPLQEIDVHNNYGLDCGCGIFEFKKKE